MKLALLLLALLPLTLVPDASLADEEADGIASSTVLYKHGDVELSGHLSLPADLEAGDKLPGVLIVHYWRGQGDFVRAKADELAGRGYVAFALDMYGKGVYAADAGEAMKLAGPFYEDPALMRGRARAGLEQLLKQPHVDPARVAAIGFCFGGTAVLELARDGADIAGVVSFHGGLETKIAAAAETFRAKVLVCHGGDDPFVPPEQVLGLWKELQAAKVDHQILVLSGAVHSFTDPRADRVGQACYDEQAATRAWSAMDTFFDEIF